jgi:hypothetical protein
MDSYQKMACDMFGNIDKPEGVFRYVKQEDLDEVVVQFALLVSELDYADNYRIFPLHMEKEFYAVAEKGCCGNVNSQMKCLSGNIYWIGCNYGH